MCKTIFIATTESLEEIPFDEVNPNFALTKITDEFSDIKNKFSNRNIYLANTSRGCGCDFGLTEIPDLQSYLERERMYPLDKLAERVRTLLGRQDEWKRKHIEKVKGQIKDERLFVKQTEKLISIIKDNATASSVVEIYCCWAGDYDSAIEDTKYVTVDDETFFDTFDIDLNEKVIVSGQRPAANSLNCRNAAF